MSSRTLERIANRDGFGIFLLFLFAIAAAMVFVLIASTGSAKAMCQNSPSSGPAAACGGYPAPPVCTTAINNAYWYGHFWAVYVNGSIVYQQGTFRCTGDYPWMWQALVGAGINPQATIWREWQIT